MSGTCNALAVVRDEHERAVPSARLVASLRDHQGPHDAVQQQDHGQGSGSPSRLCFADTDSRLRSGGLAAAIVRLGRVGVNG